jgi:hypothetical protein
MDEMKTRVQILGVKMELAILKAILLAFDITLENDPRRFTRSPSLDTVREMMVDAVQKESYDQFPRRISLGIQYNKSQALEELRNRIDGQRQEFEHVLIGAGDTVKHTLDVVWNIFGVEPWGFRVSETWTEYDFTAIIVNQALKDGGVIGPLFLKAPYDICAYTNWRSFQDDPGIDSDIIGTPISNCRMDACRKAMLKTEREADDYVWNAIINTAINSVNGDHHILLAIEKRLGRFFDDQIQESKEVFPKVMADFQQRVQPGRLGDEVTIIDNSPPESKDYWLPLYRKR